MAKKTIAIVCPTCDASYSITSESNEQIQFCPFCGEPSLLPYDDLDPEEDFGVFDEDAEFADDDDYED